MTAPSIPRARRFAGAVLLLAGLGLGGVTVLPAATVAAAQAPAAQDVVGLRKGARGDAVKALQQALVRVGIGVKYGVDSYFGSATEASVKAFQRLNGLPMTGVVDRATAAGLGLASAATPAPSPAPAPAASAATGLVGLGSTGPLVTQVQQALINFGWPIASGADGVFGASTERALKAFQKANGLGVSGRTYPATLRVLGVSATPAPAAPAAPATPAPAATTVVGLQFGARGPAVTELQKAIIAFGWPLRGGADGIFGASTQAALRKLQSANGIAASGTVDDATARLLGLGGAPAAPAATGATANGFAAYNERGRACRRPATGVDQRRDRRPWRGGRHLRLGDRQRRDGVPAGQGLEGEWQGRRGHRRRARSRRRARPDRCHATGGHPPRGQARPGAVLLRRHMERGAGAMVASTSAPTSSPPRAARSSPSSPAR